jgi:hypothetical protein
MNLESFQRTEISMQPLGPTNYTGSYACSKNTIAAVIDAWYHKQKEVVIPKFEVRLGFSF